MIKLKVCPELPTFVCHDVAKKENKCHLIKICDDYVDLGWYCTADASLFKTKKKQKRNNFFLLKMPKQTVISCVKKQIYKECGPLWLNVYDKGFISLEALYEGHFHNHHSSYVGRPRQ